MSEENRLGVLTEARLEIFELQGKTLALGLILSEILKEHPKVQNHAINLLKRRQEKDDSDGLHPMESGYQQALTLLIEASKPIDQEPES
ncbi:MAG: hypothetical protein OXC91_07290 [Rhodobacteraceae bacterium]|nr:hypothetical protein [Paracoccaceae bacterium]